MNRKFVPFIIPPMKIISISNQKGGVGKTTTAINLSYYLANLGRRVLVVDLDPQANATSGLGITEKPDMTIYDVLIDPELPIQEATIKTSYENLFIVPSTTDLVGADVELRERENWHLSLKNKLEGINDYNFVFIDTPPSLGILTVIALTAAKSVLIPVQCEYYALEGLGQLLRTLKRVKQAYNPDLKIEGFLLTMYDRRLNLSSQVEQEVRRFFPTKVYKSVIHRSVRIAESPSFGRPVGVYAPSSQGAKDYFQLAKEFLNGKESTG